MAAARRDLATIFERAPGLADRLASLAGGDPGAIVAAARTELARMSEAERVGVLDAHPRIGADPASLSALSRREQGDDADARTLKELAALNAEYERKFGFRFVVFVRGRSKGEIASLLRARMRHTRADELATGIEEFLAITHDRLVRAGT
jgi:2-oxo-4-hydroxy-4-carboxy--5-ureidoimidazoline (OHCU) decarboxylase